MQQLREVDGVRLREACAGRQSRAQERCTGAGHILHKTKLPSVAASAGQNNPHAAQRGMASARTDIEEWEPFLK
jgi:hypothetical protein